MYEEQTRQKRKKFLGHIPYGKIVTTENLKDYQKNPKKAEKVKPKFK